MTHLKRLSAPKTWEILRKEKVYAVRPKPGKHEHKYGISLAVFLRDIVGIFKTLHEIKKVMYNKEIFVDGRVIKDYKYCLGFIDIVFILRINKFFRIVYSIKGGISFIEINQKESELKTLKVIRKDVVKKGKTQIGFYDGSNLLTNEKVKMGDSVLINLKDKKIVKVLPLEKNSFVEIIKGKHIGNHGIIKNIEKQGNKTLAEIDVGDKKIKTLIENVFVEVKR